MNEFNVVITGATGMVGEGVLHECLLSDHIGKVLVINRKPCGVKHAKLKEIIHQDFFNLNPIKDQLSGYQACFFCLGVSSVGMKMDLYNKLTYTLTMHVAEILSQSNQDMSFVYVSGSGTDETEKGRMMWARIKGKTENDLMKLPFANVYCFRPGMMQPTPGLKNTLKFYKYINWLFPILKTTAPNFVSTLAEVGQAMIKVCLNGYAQNRIEVKDIHAINRG